MSNQELVFPENHEQKQDEVFLPEFLPGKYGQSKTLLTDALPQVLPHKSTDIKNFSDYISTLIKHQLYEEASDTILQEASEIMCQGLQQFKWLIELQKLMGQIHWLTSHQETALIPLSQVYTELLQKCEPL